MSQSWNFSFFTFGGLQLWCDRFVYNGWRIQENHWSKRCRLLDPFNIRRACGSYNECLDALEKAKKIWEMPSPSEHLILLIHGLGGTSNYFRVMQNHLRKAGFEAVAISYPSTRLDLQAHVANLIVLLNNLNGVNKVSFVTHGLGGLIVRELLAKKNSWQHKTKVERLVQIAPPNNGSMLAVKLNQYAFFRILLGPCLKNLTPEAVTEIPLPSCEFGIIAGGRNNEKGFCPFFFQSDNDLIIKVEETRIQGFTDFWVVNIIHSFLGRSVNVITSIEHFLNTGRFNKVKKVKKDLTSNFI